MRISLPFKYHRWIYLLFLLLLAAGLPLSKFFLSVSLFGLAGNWLWEMDFGYKWERFRKNPAILLLMAFFLLHVVALLYTDSANMKEGMRDLRIKLPLFLLPLLIGTSRSLERKEFYAVLVVFILAVFASSVNTALRAAGLVGHQVYDLRDASTQVSLIRLGLMSALCIFISVYFIFRAGWPLYARLMAVLVSAWFVAFMLYMQALTGIVVLLIVSFLLICSYAIIAKNRKRILLLLVLFLGFGGGVIAYVYNVYNTYYRQVEFLTWWKLETKTPRGGTYIHYPYDFMLENGHEVMLYVCWEELEEAWGKRSKLPLFVEGVKRNQHAYVLVRYLASRNLRKDADGVRALRDDEIRAIENGVTNYRFAEMSGMERRIYQVIWETDHYLHSADPSDHSIPMRMELWKASLAIIGQNPVFGVGTGDMPAALARQHEAAHSKLAKEWRTLHPHNQFLSLAIQLGIFGAAFFLFTLIWPGIKAKRFRNYFYLAFFFILLVSFLNEDTIETQQGVMFYAF
ncbi:MAG: O-Antigen polymerase family, partial [Bacteroidetes bacterium]